MGTAQDWGGNTLPSERQDSVMRWLVSLPATLVAVNFLFVGLILCACELIGWIDWGNEALLVAVIPSVIWAIALWRTWGA